MGNRASAMGPTPRTGWQFRRERRYDDTANQMGSPTDERVLAQLAAFESDWRRGAIEMELHQRWDYKLLKGSACLGAQTYQLRPTQNVRAWLLVDFDCKTIWYLGADHKAPSTQRQIIERLCNRAKARLEEPQHVRCPDRPIV